MILTYLAPFLAVIGFVSLINVVFTVKAFNLLADKSKVPLFRTAAIVLLSGASLTIVLGIVFAVLASSGSASLNTVDCGDSWRISARHRVGVAGNSVLPVSYTHLRAHETRHDLVCRLLLE